MHCIACSAAQLEATTHGVTKMILLMLVSAASHDDSAEHPELLNFAVLAGTESAMSNPRGMSTQWIYGGPPSPEQECVGWHVLAQGSLCLLCRRACRQSLACLKHVHSRVRPPGVFLLLKALLPASESTLHVTRRT